MKTVENSYALASSVRDLNCRGIHLRWSFSLSLFDQRGSSAESGLLRDLRRTESFVAQPLFEVMLLPWIGSRWCRYWWLPPPRCCWRGASSAGGSLVSSGTRIVAVLPCRRLLRRVRLCFALARGSVPKC